MVVIGSPLRRMHQSLAQGDFLAEEAAAATKFAFAFEADKSAQNGESAGAGEVSLVDLGVAALGCRSQHAGGGSNDRRFLLGREFVEGDWRGRRFLGRHASTRWF